MEVYKLDIFLVVFQTSKPINYKIKFLKQPLGGDDTIPVEKISEEETPPPGSSAYIPFSFLK